MGPGPPPWDDTTYHSTATLDPDLTQHIQTCTCPCNHLGYGPGTRTRKIPEDKVLPPTPPSQKRQTPQHPTAPKPQQPYDVLRRTPDHHRRQATSATQTPDPGRRQTTYTFGDTPSHQSQQPQQPTRVSVYVDGNVEREPETRQPTGTATAPGMGYAPSVSASITHTPVHHQTKTEPAIPPTAYTTPTGIVQTPSHHAVGRAPGAAAGNYIYVDYERIRPSQIPSPSPSRLQTAAPTRSPIRYWQAGTVGRSTISQLNHLTHHQRRYFAQQDDSFSTASSDEEPTYHRRPWCLCVFLCFLLTALSAALVVPMLINKTYLPETHRGPDKNTTSTALNGDVAINKYSTYSPKQRLEVIKKLLKESPLIDAHNDLPWNIRKFVHNRLRKLDLSKSLKNSEPWSSSPWSQTDLPRLRAGLVGAQFWSAYVPCESQYLDAVQLTLEQIDVIKRLVHIYRKDLELVYSAREILEVHRTGKIASLIGIEGGHSLGNSMGVLRSLYDLGARYVTLTHTCDTPWAASASLHESGFVEPVAEGEPGLTTFGLNIIREMNRLGMMVDLSHTSVATVRAALNVTKAPVIFSHSSAYAVCNSTRNVPDDLLRLLAKNRGIVMVNFYANIVNCNGSNVATMNDVISHIKHIRKIAGVDYVGLGAGYDGINATPSGLNDVSKYPQLLSTLLAEPGWTERDILKLAGLNLLRVFEEVEKVRDGWKLAAIPPAEDVHPPSHLPENAPKCQYERS